jgi:hypothetical protein
MKPIAHETFLPWLRQGIARRITAVDGDPSVRLRTTVPVELELAAEGGPAGRLTAGVSRQVEIYGPGDIIGIDRRAMVRNEPRDWITNFEPNYLAFVEFYDEDFPWRYTPAAPNGHRLRPWIMLAVLEEGEFEEGRNLAGRPLPFIKIPQAAGRLPAPGELWAWAHAHVNASLDSPVISDPMEAALPRLAQVLQNNPDHACSRLLCPRQLRPNAAYHAFVLPSFESGRLAGLGLDPAGTPFATESAMATYSDRPDGDLYPYYHRWYFRTGTIGDFEYLVRLLVPRPVNSKVGRREMDLSHPEGNLPPLNHAEVGNILRLGGALRVPVDTLKPEEHAEFLKYENWAQPAPHPWQVRLGALLNLADEYRRKSLAQAHGNPDVELPEEEAGDPLITAPIYGQWHALTQRVLVNADGTPAVNRENWVHELNLDPRFRVAAGFGTRVVQENQEKYMDAAWNQIGKVLEGNRRIRRGQLAEMASFSWHQRYLSPLAVSRPERFLQIAAPLHRRVLSQGVTVLSHVQSSRMPLTVLAVPLRRAMRPGGRLVKKLPFGTGSAAGSLVARLNSGEVRVAPPKVVAGGVVTLDQAAALVDPADAPGWLIPLLRTNPLLPMAPLALAILIVILLLLFASSPLWFVVGGLAAGGLVVAWRRLARWQAQDAAAASLREEHQTPDAVRHFPNSADFRLAKLGENLPVRRGGADSPEAARFKVAMGDLHQLLAVSEEAAPKLAVRQPLALSGLAAHVAGELEPSRTIPRRVLSGVLVPERLRAQMAESFDDVMAYPVFDQPMYEPLKNISSELFLPNIHLIEPNTISLLETNQRFIEAYMVGLNHEFARELLWREYPTDQRGSYFRQFWDPSSFFPPPPAPPPGELRERLRDIPELHTWGAASVLGDHDHRERPGESEEELVLVIRGELLKKYPNTVVYAHKAAWQKKEGSSENDLTRPRTLAPLSAGQEEHPPRDIVRTPLYEAQVAPDIYFLGFDLTAAVARGESGENPNDDPGWFFVLKERPGEPRFGLDTPPENDIAPGPPHGWNDLAWGPQLLNAQGHLKAAQSVNLNFQAPPEFVNGQKNPEFEQYEEDRQVTWTSNVSAAELAYILYQVPFMVAVHASEMLPK